MIRACSWDAAVEVTLPGVIELGIVPILVLVAANGFFVTSEVSLVAVRRRRIAKLVAAPHQRCGAPGPSIISTPILWRPSWTSPFLLFLWAELVSPRWRTSSSRFSADLLDRSSPLALIPRLSPFRSSCCRIVGHSSLGHDAPKPVSIADQFQPRSTGAVPMVQAACWLTFARQAALTEGAGGFLAGRAVRLFGQEEHAHSFDRSPYEDSSQIAKLNGWSQVSR
jgi:hypothetical protein